jgi:hypothetical protein
MQQNKLTILANFKLGFIIWCTIPSSMKASIDMFNNIDHVSHASSMYLSQAFTDTTKFNVAMPWKRTRKGKTIVTKEEKQFCRLMLHVLQDPITINEQKIKLLGENY